MKLNFFKQNTKKNILEILKKFLQEEVKPVAHKLENDLPLLKKMLAKMGDLSLLGARGPTEYGGLNLDNETYHFFKEALFEVSLPLGFLQTQHQTSVEFMKYSSNKNLKETYLSKMINGECLFGMGLSHLAKYDTPMATGILRNGSYSVNGKIPFITGYDYFDKVIIGFVIENEHKEKQEVLALVPFASKEIQEGGKLIYSNPMPLIVTQSANTVSLEMKDWIIDPDDIVMINPLGTFYKSSLTKTNVDSFHAGVALAALNIIKDSPPFSKLKEVQEYYTELVKELDDYRKTILKREKDTLVSPIRAWGIELTDKCIAFATQVSGGRSISSLHPLNQVRNAANLLSVITGDDNLLKAVIERKRKNNKSEKIINLDETKEVIKNKRHSM